MKMKLEFPSRLLRSARALFGSSSGSAGGAGPEVDDGGRDVEGREGTPRRSARRSARTAAAKVGGLPLPLSGARRSRRVARVGSWGTKKATIVATTKKVQAEEAPVPAPRLKRRKRRQAQPKRALIIELLPDELFDGPVSYFIPLPGPRRTLPLTHLPPTPRPCNPSSRQGSGRPRVQGPLRP